MSVKDFGDDDEEERIVISGGLFIRLPPTFLLGGDDAAYCFFLFNLEHILHTSYILTLANQ